MEHFDVVIVGAGLSGIGAAVHLQTQCPGRTYAILEGRDAIGGTWDLFRYPGIRSDSDMYTLGYAFKPWTQAKAIADGPSILNYVRETAREHGIDPHIRYGHKVLSAAWSTPDAAWTVTAEQDGQTRTFTCNSCSCVAATIPMTAATPRTSRAPRPSRAASSIRRTGRATWTTPARRWW